MRFFLATVLFQVAALAHETDNSGAMCLAEWTTLSQRVNSALLNVDFTKSASVRDAKRICDFNQLDGLSQWPNSLQSQMVLCLGELAHGQGHFDAARQYFEWVVATDQHSIGAQAAYRLAEIEEQLVWSAPRRGNALRNTGIVSQDIASLLKGVASARDAFMKVVKYKDTFWNRRAAFRVITLMDDALWEIQYFADFPYVAATTSPFDVLFAHQINSAVLDEHVFALEQERMQLEAALRKELKDGTDDPVLYAALVDRAQDAYAISPSFTQMLIPPWASKLPENMVIRHRSHYYKLGKDDTLISLKHVEALTQLRTLLSDSSRPVPYAFALAYLADELEPSVETHLADGIQSSDDAIQLAALYASQKLPSHVLTGAVLAAWASTSGKHDDDKPLFRNAQSFLFGRKERILLSLSAHFSLGRESTKRILASPDLSDEEKAWLLQFRKDKTSTAQAAYFLNHRNSLVRSRAQHAMRLWNASAQRGG